MFSSCHPESLERLAESIGKNACYGLPAESAKYSEVMILSVPWTQAADALKLAGSLKDKILIDRTNHLKPDMSGLQSDIIPLRLRRWQRWLQEPRW
jgi:predicted dinucleotide-binding enzyme